MSRVTTVTIAELRAVWEHTLSLVDELGLLTNGERLELCEGDAYRLWQVALVRAGSTGHDDPREGGLPRYLGQNKREAAQTLRGVNAALSAALKHHQETTTEMERRCRASIGAPVL